MRAILVGLSLGFMLFSGIPAHADVGDQNDHLRSGQSVVGANPISVRGSRGTMACLPWSVRQQADVLVARFGGRVSSTHRPGANVGNRPGHPSMHRYCRAADVHVPRRLQGGAFAYLQAHRIGGLGRYRWGFHVDDGSVRQWAGGRKATRYAKRRHRHRYAGA